MVPDVRCDHPGRHRSVGALGQHRAGRFQVEQFADRFAVDQLRRGAGEASVTDKGCACQEQRRHQGTGAAEPAVRDGAAQNQGQRQGGGAPDPDRSQAGPVQARAQDLRLQGPAAEAGQEKTRHEQQRAEACSPAGQEGGGDQADHGGVFQGEGQGGQGDAQGLGGRVARSRAVPVPECAGQVLFRGEAYAKAQAGEEQAGPQAQGQPGQERRVRGFRGGKRLARARRA